MKNVMAIVDEIEGLVVDLRTDTTAFQDKGNGAAGTRARKGALAIAKLCKVLRDGVSEIKDERKPQ